MTSTYVLYEQINALGEFQFTAGTDFNLTFTVYDEDGVTLQNIGGATTYVTFSPFGQSYNILQKSGSLIDDYSFEVNLLPADTESLSGKYIVQPVIQSFYGQQYRPSQAIVLINPAIPLN